MREPTSMLRTVDLPGGSLIPFTSVPGERVRVVYGSVWLTEEGNPRDAFLASGEEIALGSRGLAVIEAFGPARIQLYDDVRAPSAAARAAAALGRRLSQWIARFVPQSPVARGTV